MASQKEIGPADAQTRRGYRVACFSSFQTSRRLALVAVAGLLGGGG